MELLHISISLVSLFIILIVFLSQSKAKNLPPGKTGWPVIGESIEYLGAGWKGQPEKFIFERISNYTSYIFKTNLMLQPTVVSCDAPAHKFLFANENKLIQSWWPSSVDKIFPSSTQTSSKEEAIKMRKMLPNFFKPEALQRWVSVNPSGLARDTISSLHQGVRIHQKGVPNENHQAKKDQLGGGEGITNARYIVPHMLLTADEDGKFMTESDIADKILGLLIGGHDTASSACAFIVKYLAELPHIYQGVYKGMYVPNFTVFYLTISGASKWDDYSVFPEYRYVVLHKVLIGREG
ncbi:hypothetical protein HYC85_025796 [Camellia sinensis]|uniref:Cytochrome P450 n=1 Tax=Camellia sinensis TaxID=4442 RepID=A0A7J7GC59_CAMSI|nr:hypothetical protein HYC85_025796 [Camellia sinensis]